MELGARLKEAREAKKLTIDDIQKVTKIQSRYIQAIEKGNYDVMPGSFYVRAFIKEYATAVDLDPDELMEEHEAELPKSTEDSSIQYTRVQRSRKDSSPSKNPAIFSFLPTVIVVLLIIGIAFTVWFFNINKTADDKSEQTDPIEETDTGDTVTLPPDEETDSDENEDTNGSEVEEKEKQLEEEEIKSQEPTLSMVESGDGETTYELENAGETLELELSSENDHWLEVENGKGKSFYNKMFFPDDSPKTIDLSGEEQIYLRFGDPTNLSISVNGVSLQLPEDIDPSQVQKVWINVINN